MPFLGSLSVLSKIFGKILNKRLIWKTRFPEYGNGLYFVPSISMGSKASSSAFRITI